MINCFATACLVQVLRAQKGVREWNTRAGDQKSCAGETNQAQSKDCPTLDAQPMWSWIMLRLHDGSRSSRCCIIVGRYVCTQSYSRLHTDLGRYIERRRLISQPDLYTKRLAGRGSLGTEERGRAPMYLPTYLGTYLGTYIVGKQVLI